jgi:hypothetical protein
VCADFSKQPIYCRRTHRHQFSADGRLDLQMLVALQRRRQHRQYRFGSLSANSFRCFPEHYKSITHRTVIQMASRLLHGSIGKFTNTIQNANY